MRRWALALSAVVMLCAAFGDVLALQRVGEEVALRIETQHPYAGPGQRESSARVREETLRHPGATYIAVHFASFQLAEGDYVVVRSPDGTQSWRYEGLGRAGMGMSPGGFWAAHIKGDTAVVELFSRQAVGAHGYAIDRYARGYTYAELVAQDSTNAAPMDIEAVCGLDDTEWAKCYETSEPEIYEKSRAVARLLILGSFTCTGWLLGCEGHLVTNNHCIATQTDANNTDYEFMAEGATCSTNCFGSLSCPGTIAATSGQLIKTNAPLDYALVKLPTNVSATYGFLSLRDTGPVVDERIYLPQHPVGRGKSIAVFSTAPQDQSGFCEISSLNAPPCTGGTGDIGYYADTQGGSSGSPVLAYDDHKVVSLHHCANCPNRGLDVVDLIASIGSDLPECATNNPVGSVALDADDYKCSDAVAITVHDDSLQGQSSHPVTVDSETESGGEVVTLVPNPPGSGTFVGSVSLVESPALEGDGMLSVTDGDTLSVTYLDEDDGQGGVNVPRQAMAGLDCVAPAISGVQATNVGLTSATIVWATDEPATSHVTYGTTPPGSQTAELSALVTSHGVELSNLVQCAEYFYSVSSVDDVGNSATDDNGGAFHQFAMGCTPPPAVPDGSGGTTPLTVERLTADGSQLRLYWDADCLFAPGKAKILYGALGNVSSYAVDGAVCGITRLMWPKKWTTVPSGDAWFVMSGDNGFGHEATWGTDSAGQERNGLVPSGECASVVKDLSGSCP